jgi:hypothetical protein
MPVVEALHEIVRIQRDRHGFLPVSVDDGRDATLFANGRRGVRADAFSDFRLQGQCLVHKRFT